MAHVPRNPAKLPPPHGRYAHALEVQPSARYLFVSGQIPGAEHTTEVPATFEAQCSLIWENIVHILEAADMVVDDIVKVTTYLTHPAQAQANSEIRQRYLGEHAPALTVVVAHLLQANWMLEIEIIAAKVD